MMVPKGGRRVGELTGLEAVVQLAEELVEQVALGADMPVAVVSSPLVVGPTRKIVEQRRAHPCVACRGDSVVLCAAVANMVTLAGVSGDRRRAGIRFECSSIGEALGIVADFGQKARAPVSAPAPGMLVMMAAEGCDKNRSSAAAVSTPTASQTVSSWRSSVWSWMPITSSTSSGCRSSVRRR